MEAVPIAPWEQFLTTDFGTVTAEVKRLSEIEDPETEPFKSKDDACVLLKQLTDRVKRYIEAETGPQQEEMEDKLAELNFRLGWLYIETEQSGLGEPLVSRAVDHLQCGKPQYRVTLQEALNTLGVLWCNRNDHRKAHGYLLQSEEVYQDCVRDDKFESGSVDRLESQFTLTLFYLAQVAAHMGDQHKSADYCSCTLNRQLESNSYDKGTWAQNAAQLAGFYVGQKDWVSAGRCLSAAYHVFHHRPAPDAAPSDPSTPSRDEDVATNIHLGLGKLYGQQLKQAREQALAAEYGTLDAYADTSPSSASSSLFSALSDREDEAEFKHVGYIPVAFKGARALFNAAMRQYRRALEYYLLDGFVTEHLEILMELSGMYKNLAHFEAEVHRQCVMHRMRARPLEPILPDLNPKMFPAPWKEIHYELGDTFRTIMEMKKDTARPFHKIEKAGKKAITYYSGYIEAVEEGQEARSEDGRVNDVEEASWLTARFCRARVFHSIQHQPGPGAEVDVTAIKSALSEFEYILRYASLHQLREKAPETFLSELSLCEEMVELLPLKIAKLHQNASAPSLSKSSSNELIESANQAMAAAEIAIESSMGGTATSASVAALTAVAEAA